MHTHTYMVREREKSVNIWKTHYFMILKEQYKELRRILASTTVQFVCMAEH